jgi:glycosyltransferase involved in cell wall biosynthesis
MYAERYPGVPASKWSTIFNGYDEENFVNAEAALRAREAADQRIALVHSGVLYPSERDPTAFFDALAELKAEGSISRDNLAITLRATGFDDKFRPMIEQRQISDVVALAPSIHYSEALKEMLHMDGLLLFQASNCNRQIPAKLYEYFRARKPIFALTDPTGDTAEALLEQRIDTIANIESKAEIKQALLSFLQRIRDRTAPVARLAAVAKYSRAAATRRLAELFDGVVAR